MKRSRIFTGVSALVLAVVGIAATKATSKFVNYYYQESATLCSVAPTPSGCDGGPETCTATINHKSYTIFSVRSSNGQTCSVAHTKP